ncbi:MAG: drug/metabolite transporter (DMT)-like permease, partial [Alphaproteobacteria bacterium]
RDVPPLGLGFWRVMGPAILLTPIYGRELYVNRAVVARHWKVLSILGFCMSVLGGSALYLGVSLTTAMNGGVVMTSQTAVMAVMGWLFFRDQINTRQGIGLVIAAVGVLVVVARGDVAILLGLHLQIGDLLVFAAILGYSAYVVLLRSTPSELSPFSRLCAVSWFGALFAAPLYVWEIIYVEPFPYTLDSMAMILWISFAVSILAVGFMTIGTLAVGSYISSMFFYVRTVFIAALAILVLGENIALYHVAGVVLIFAGIYLMTARRRQVAAQPPA